jgi:hypothetical protein
MMIKLRCGLHTIFLIALIIGLSWFQVVWADLNDELVAYYPFNGNANDASGNGNNGMVTGATLTDDRFGNIGNAYNFDGDDYIVLESATGLQITDDFTVSAWIYKTDDDIRNQERVERIVGLFQSQGSFQPIYSMMYSGDSNLIRMQVKDGSNNWNRALNTIYSKTRMTSKSWHHLVFTLNTSQYSFYLDGVLDGIGTWGNKVRNSDPSPYLGIGVRGDLFNLFHGSIDDIRIYNRALSGDEVKQLYQMDEPDELLVELSGFTAIPTKNGVALNWDTGAEPDSQAFHIWRGTPDLGSYCGCSRNLEDYKKISMLDKNGKPILIPTTGDERMGAKYSHLDKAAKPGIAYCYVLEDINSEGKSEFYFEYIVFTPDSVSE